MQEKTSAGPQRDREALRFIMRIKCRVETLRRMWLYPETLEDLFRADTDTD